MNDVKLFLESCQSLVLYALVALSLGVLTASSAVALMKSVKLSAVKICRYGFLGVFFMSVMFGIGVSIGSVKVPGDPTNQVQQGQVSGEPLRRPGGWPPCQPSDLGVPLRSGGSQVQITDEEITNCWRVAEMREGCEIVARDVFDAPQIHEDWLVRGGFMDVMRIPAACWSFPWRDGFLEVMTVFSDGGLRPALRTPYFPPPFEAPLAVVPSFNWNLLPGGVSNVFWHAVSPSNSLVVTWENSPVNRNVNCITNFQAEFFTDGRFAYRYQDHAVDYAPVFPFDWDGDGLENSVDPEPLVAGPDAHGTNVEWYNIVCSNVYEAVEAVEPVAAPVGTEIGPRDLAPPGISLSPRTSDVNTNAYYFVAVVASRGPAPIYFTADGESRLGNPVVVARAGETNHVPLLIGATYTVSSTAPLAIEAPPSAMVTQMRDGSSFTVTWSSGFSCSSQGGLFVPVVSEHARLAGEFFWTGGCCLLVNGITMRYACNGCGCGGCSAAVNYGYEGYALVLAVEGCGCAGAGTGTPRVDLDTGAYVTVGFDKKGVIYERAYDNSPTDHVERRSTRTILTLRANGGENGGVLRIRARHLSRLKLIDGSRPSDGAMLTLAPYQQYELISTNEGRRASLRLDDIEVSAALTDASTHETAQVHASASSVRLLMKAAFEAPENQDYMYRHVYGVGEKVRFRTFPKSSEIMFATRKLDAGLIAGSGFWDYELFDGEEQIDASAVREYICPISGNYQPPLKVTMGDVEYEPLISLVEPQEVVTRGVFWGENNVGIFYDGNRRCWPNGTVGAACLATTNYIGPMNVSFRGIAVSEVPCTEEDVVTGCFTNAPDKTHNRDAGAGRAHCIGEGNFWFVDAARAHGQMNNWAPDSTMIWKIPVGWHRRLKNPGHSDWFVANDPDYEVNVRTETRPLLLPGSPNRYKQELYIDENGVFTIRKFGHWISRSPSCRVILDGTVLQENHAP